MAEKRAANPLVSGAVLVTSTAIGIGIGIAIEIIDRKRRTPTPVKRVVRYAAKAIEGFGVGVFLAQTVAKTITQGEEDVS